MSGTLGLIEVLLVFAFVLGFGLYELRKTRRDARCAADEAVDPGREEPSRD